MAYVTAARASGASDRRIILRHIAPNILGPIVVLASLDIGWIILGIAGLSFLGLGAQPPTPEWGAMLSDARPHLQTAPHLILLPGAAIFVAVLGFNLLGDGLRDLLDPPYPASRALTDEDENPYVPACSGGLRLAALLEFAFVIFGGTPLHCSWA